MAYSKSDGTFDRKRYICHSIFSTALLTLWVLTGFGCFLCHVAIGKVVPPLNDMEDNLRKGFFEVLKFDSLDADALRVKNSSADALKLCDVLPEQCPEPPEPTPPNRESSSEAQKIAIEEAFSRTFDTILKVANDKYFGTDAFYNTAMELRTIIDDLKEVDGTDFPCQISNVMYCGIWSSSDAIAAKASADVKPQLDKFINTDLAQKWEDKSGLALHETLQMLHGVPYILVLAMVFLTLWWWKDAVCCSGGSCCGKIFMLFFMVLWLVFTVMSAAICGIGYIIRNKSEDIELDPAGEVFQGNPSLKDILDHIQTEYPEFWKIVFPEDLIAGLEQVNGAFVVFLAVCMVSLIYSLTVCICRPYQENAEKDVLYNI